MRKIYFVHLNCNANLFFLGENNKKSIIVYPVLKSRVKSSLKKPSAQSLYNLKICKKRYATNNQMKLHLRFLRILTKLRILKPTYL